MRVRYKAKAYKKPLSIVAGVIIVVGLAAVSTHLLFQSHAQTLTPDQYYAQFSNGVPTSSSFFPIVVWLQDSAQTTEIESGYSNVANAAAAAGINTFLGFNDWPSGFGVDNSTQGQGAQMQAACNAGEYMIVGGDPNSNTSAASVASVLSIADGETQAGTGLPCSKYLIGYDWDDEPDQCTVDVPGQVATIYNEDSTRETIDNMSAWVTWNNSGCTSTANAAFAAPAIPGADDYHDIDPYNAVSCEEGEHVSSSPWADCSWLYSYQAARQTSLSTGKPTWEFIETGNDAYGFSGEDGSCNITTNVCPNGNEYNGTAPQVNADAWGAIINGANGIEWFCQGTAQGQSFSYSDCLGGNGTASNAIFANLKYIDGNIKAYAPELNTTSSGACTMQPIDDANSLPTSCNNGDLTLSTSNSTEPIMGMTKVVGGNTYLFVEADRANGSTTGTYTVSGDDNDTATLVYDSAAQYDPSASEQGQTFNLNGSGQFSDSLVGDDGAGTNDYGTDANSYQVKIYEIAGTDEGSTPPTVSITSPAANAEIYSNNATTSAIDATATANDGGSIASVELLVNGTIVATDTSAPYDFNLDTLDYHDGTYPIGVLATDDQGNTSTASENVYISNGDLNGAGSVGIFDLTTLASHWGQTGTYQQGNITNNGPIGIYDLSALANNWGWSE